jgi:tetratricopeptide (TPR) repeat protein
LWISNPSPVLLKRYSIFITSSDVQDEWLANFYRDELSASIKLFRSKDVYFFPQRWSYLARVNLNEKKFEDICRKVAIHQVVFGKIVEEENKQFLKLELRKYPEGKSIKNLTVQINSQNPENNLAEVIDWMKTFFPVKKDYHFNGITDKTFIEARDEFFKRNYEKSSQLLKQVMDRYPDNSIVQKWYYYNVIKLAGMSRPNKKPNPFETKKMPWQNKLSEARNLLKKVVQENLDQNVQDDFLSNMLAESYLWEENFGEAEIFLKNAYVENPFNIYVLENLTNLHPSRYQDLEFKYNSDIYERIVNLCPIYADVLIKYTDNLLKITPIHGVASTKARDLIENFLTINPNSATSWLLLGEYYHASLNREKAFHSYFKADSLEPNNTIVQYNLGIMYYLEEGYDEAEKHFKKAIKFGNYLDAHLYLGSVYLKKGEYKKALERFRYRVENKKGEDDIYAKEAMRGIRHCLAALNIPLPEEVQ